MQLNSTTQGLVPLPKKWEGLSKRQITEMADNSVEHILEEGSVFGVAEALAAMEEFVKTVRRDERYIQYLRDELAKHHGKLITASGAKIETCEAGVQYDYSVDATWCQLKDGIEQLTLQKKEREESLKSVAPGRIGVDHETGEVIEGAKKTSKSTYRITLKK